MSWQSLAIANTVIFSGCFVLISAFWVDIPRHWQPGYYTGIPVLSCALMALSLVIRQRLKERRNRDREPEEMEKLVISIRYIDEAWHDALELARRFIEEGRHLFSGVNGELHQIVGEEVSGANWRYKGITEIASESLRVSDSILCQLWTGHPDTALGTTRQLFELMMFQKVIALDLSGETAKRYQDFPEMRYLQDSIDSGSRHKESHGKRLGSIRSRYPQDISFKPLFAWVKLQNGRIPNSMEDVIEYVVRQLYEDVAERKEARNFYLNQWVKLNSWAHISKPAARRKLGLRTEGGYQLVNLLEKSRVGLDTPLSMAVIYLRSILHTLESTAHDVTEKSHPQHLGKIKDTYDEICRALDSVSPEFLANDFRIRVGPIGDETDEPYEIKSELNNAARADPVAGDTGRPGLHRLRLG